MATKVCGSASAGKMAVGIAFSLCFLLSFVSPSNALRCYQCGLYTDGVGSITPCINYTAEKHLKECPASESHCIKYVSEGSTVRDCANECTEKESWGIKIYCCDTDGCNGSSALSQTSFLLFSCPIIVYLAAKLLQVL